MVSHILYFPMSLGKPNIFGLCRTMSWMLMNSKRRFVMQDHKDPRAFTIVERYAHESSQKVRGSLGP